MTKSINILGAGSINGGLGVGVMMAGGNPWAVPDGLADDLVNRGRAAYVVAPVANNYGAPLWSDAAGTTLIKPDGTTAVLGTGAPGGGSTTVVNDQTTGGTTSALSAQMGVSIKSTTDGLTSSVAAKVASVAAGTGVTVTGTATNPIINASASAPAWGAITGTLASQTDLSTALSGKVASVAAGSGVSITGTAANPIINATASGGSVTSASVVTANGVSGTVANPSTTPAITLILGAITPSSVASTGAVSGSNLSGTNSGDQTITLTGDATGSGTASFAVTLANTAVTAGAYTNANVTVDGKGRVTAVASGAAGGGGSVTSTSVTTANGVSGTVATATTTPAITLTLGAITPTSVAATGTVTGSNLSGTNTNDETLATIKSKLGVTTLSGSNSGDETAATIKTALGVTTLSGSNTGDQTITLTGDATGSGTSSFALTLANTAVTAGAYTNANVTVDGKGRVTAVASGAAGGGGSVTSASVTTANGVSGTVATPSTTPAITLTLGAITPASVAATGTIGGSNFSGTSSGTNTGDQTPSSATPAALGTATAGSLTTFSRGDHVHAMPTAANVGALALTGGTMSGALNAAPTVTIPSAASVAIGAAAANTVTISGSTAITSFDTIAVGAERRVVFSGVLTLTHDPVKLILPGAASITTAVNDAAHFISLGSGNWQCLSYAKASGAAVVAGTPSLNNAAITGAATYSGVLADQSTVEMTFATSTSYTVGANISSLHNLAAAGNVYSTTVVMPASPINGQSLTITNGPSTWYITHSPNTGQNIPEPITGLQPFTSTKYRYQSATSAWIREVAPARAFAGGGDYIAYMATAVSDTYRMRWFGLSWDIYLTYGKIWSQSTASGVGNNPSTLYCHMQNTLDWSSNSTAHGQYSITGYRTEIQNPLGVPGNGSITALSGSTTTATATVSAGDYAKLVTGQKLAIYGATPASFNSGSAVITLIGGNQFTYTTTSFTGTATGTLTWAATLDAAIGFYTMSTAQMFSAGNLYTGSPAGARNWLLFNKFAPLRIACGDPIAAGGPGSIMEFSNIDGSAKMLKPLCDLTAVKDAGTASFTVADDVMTQVLAGSGIVTVKFPATPRSGQSLTLAVRTAYTTITVDGNGKTLVAGAALTGTAGSFARWQYNLLDTTWDRVG